MAKSKKDVLKSDLGLSDQHKKKLERIIQRSLEEQAKDGAKEIREQIAPGGELPPQQMWLPVAPMPTDMCRVSPFFPMARQDLAHRNFIRDMVITDSSWGQILFTGPKLSTYEEDVLNAVLAILNEVSFRRKTEHEGKQTYTYQGPLLPILRLINPNVKKFANNHYKRAISALELMAVSAIKLVVYKRLKGGKPKVASWEIMNLLSYAKWDEDKKELTVTVNPFFYENFARKSVTLLDVIQRAELRSPIAKSLHRFVMSHKGNVWEGHFLTLAQTLNLNMEQPNKKTKQQIKQAVKKLVDQKLLEADSGIARNSDVVKLVRTQSAKQRRTRVLK
jgi:hypothetical protein